LIFILAALWSTPYLSSSYFFNQYTTAAHQKAARENGIQICCSWGKEIDDGILTYRIADDDDANPQVIQAVHQAVDEWNSKVPNIQLQEITHGNADIDIKKVQSTKSNSF
jgi:hypothetical protein